MTQNGLSSLPTHNGSPDTGFGSKGYRSYVMGSLLLVYIFNFIDRSIINILTDPIKESFQVEDWQMGLLGGPAFAFLYTFLGIPIARLAERNNRVLIIALSVGLWSLMTAVCGIAPTFLVLFLFRVGVSIGEAGCTPPAQSLIADYYTPKNRATAVSVYALGVPLGGMLAAIFGGLVADKLDGPLVLSFLETNNMTFFANMLDWKNIEGWRVAFMVVGLPGVLLAVIVKFTMKEPPRGYTDPSNAQITERVSFSKALAILAAKPTFWHIVAGATVASFIGYGVGQFSTSFFLRSHGLNLSEAALSFGLILGLCAAVGVFTSGYLADKVAHRHPTALSWIPALGMAVSAPLYVVGFLVESYWMALPPLMLAAMLHYYYLGPMYAIVGGVVDSRTRATSVAIALFLINLIGYGLGPVVIGFLSTFLKAHFLSGMDENLTLEACRALANTVDSTTKANCSSADAKGLQWSLIIFCCGYVWAALHYLLAGKTLQRDMLSSQSEVS